MHIYGSGLPPAFLNIKLNPTPVNMKSKASFSALLNQLIEVQSTVYNQSSSLEPGVGPYTSYDELFDSGFFGENAVRIPDNREIKYCSLCGSEIESDGSCPICIVPLKLCGNTAAQNRAIENQHLQNHIQQQSATQTTGSTSSNVKSGKQKSGATKK